MSTDNRTDAYPTRETRPASPVEPRDRYRIERLNRMIVEVG